MKRIIINFLDPFLKLVSKVIPVNFNTTAELVIPATQGTFTLPVNIHKLPSSFAAKFDINYVLNKVHIYTIKNSYINSNGFIYKNLHIFEPSLPSSWIKPTIKFVPFLRQFYKVKKGGYNEGSIIIFHDAWSDNYYHWLVDALPRLLILDSSYERIKVGLPVNSPDYVRRTVTALGFDNHHVFEDGETIYSETIIIPERTAYGVDHNPQLLKKLHNKLTFAFHSFATAPDKYVYASRQNGKTRKILNEADILPVLDSYGFETVYFEKLSFLEQVLLMGKTKIMVGLHGANLANALFMQPGSIVIELMNESYPNLVYYHMCSNLGLRYFSVPCTGEKTDSKPDDMLKIFDQGLNSVNCYVDPVCLGDIINDAVVLSKKNNCAG